MKSTRASRRSLKERELERLTHAEKGEIAELLEAKEENALADQARNKLEDFCRLTYPGYATPWHLRLLMRALEALERGEIRNLMVFMPPRHGKSQLSSIEFPAWFLGRNPQRSVIVASYAGGLALSFGRATRDVILSPQYQRVWQYDLATAAGHHWMIAGKKDKRASYISAGAGGSLTGEGADLFIVDDPVKDAMEATSALRRERVWEWYRNVVRTRLQPLARQLLIMTRWHMDDLAGRIERLIAAGGGDKWLKLVLPAVNPDGKHSNPHTPAYEALWPERYPVSELAQIKATIGTRAWTALYQQTPTEEEGGIIKRAWFRFWTVMPAEFETLIQSWDMSFKETQTSSFVVGEVWGRKGPDRYLLDQVRDRMDFPATLAAVRTMTAKWPSAHAKLVEEAANGPAVISSLRSEIAGLIPVGATGTKEARLAAAAPDFEGGNVYVPSPNVAPWVHDYIEELVTFPNGLTDDQCDATSQALHRFREANPVLLQWLRDELARKKAEEAGATGTPTTSSLGSSLLSFLKGTEGQEPKT